MHSRERRKHPRLEASVPCQLHAGSLHILAQTKDLSCSGLSCALEQSFPLMTKLEIRLFLPPLHTSVQKYQIRCSGVVVYQEKIRFKNKPRFLTGVFFSQIEPEKKRRLAEFVLHSMLSHA